MKDTINIELDNHYGIEFEMYANGTMSVMVYIEKLDCKECLSEKFLEEWEYKNMIKGLITII